MQEPAGEAASSVKRGVEPRSQMIGRYKLLEKLGEGGFGEVWMAEQREPVKRRVALKIIKLGMDTKQVVARFEAERQALAMMDHPNIAKVLDAGTTGEPSNSSSASSAQPSAFPSGRPYFVMELVRGIKITDYCDQNQLPTKERLDLFIQVCQAIQHAHQKGIIHRDIKPSNILVTLHDGAPAPKVIDFGIAKATQQELTDKTVFTQFSQFIGTPAYISPEQAELSGMDIDTRADMYSLGVLLYELLVGQTPFDPREVLKSGLDALRRMILEQEPARPSSKLSTLQGEARTTTGKQRQADVGKLAIQFKGELDWIVLKALEKDRTRRYDTATAFAEDIRRYLNNEPVNAVAPTAFYLFKKYARRHKTALAVAAVLAITILASATYSIAQAVKANRAATAAKAAEQLANINLGAAQQERNRAQQLAEKLDAANEQTKAAATRALFTSGNHFIESGQASKGLAHLARSLRTDPGYWPSLTRLISTLTDRGIALDDLPLITHERSISDHVLDRATGLLVTRGELGDLRVWNAWKAEKLMDIPAAGSRKLPSLSADGRRVLFVDANGAAQVFEPFTNPRTPLATLRPEGVVADAVLGPGSAGAPAGEAAPLPGVASDPGGPRWIAATRLTNGTVQFWNAENGEALSAPLTAPATNGGFFSFTRDGQWLAGSFADGQTGVWPVPPRNGAMRLLATQTNSLLTLAPDSKTLVERASDGLSIRFWDLAAGAAKGEAVKLTERLAPLPGVPETLTFSGSHGHEFLFRADGLRMLAVSHGTFEAYSNQILNPKVEVHLFDVSTGKRLRTTSETNVTYHDENLAASLGAMVINTNRLVVRGLSTGATFMDRTWPSDTIQKIKFAPAGDRILVALTDRRLMLFDPRTGESLTHPGDPAFISNVAGGSGRAPGKTYFMRHGPRLRDLEFSPEGDVFLAEYADGSGQLWDAFEGLPLGEPVPVTRHQGQFEFSRDARWLVARGGIADPTTGRYESSVIRVISRDLSAARHRILPYEGAPPVLHFSADGRYGLVGSDGLLVFNPATGEVIRKIHREHTGSISSVGGHTWLIAEAWFSPSGDRIAALCDLDAGRVVKVFETASGRTLHTLPPQRMSLPFRVRFAGENRVVVGSFVYEEGVMPLKVWDLPSERVIAEAKPARGPYIFDVSPDGRRIASGGKGLALLDAADLKPVSPVLAHREGGNELYSIAFSPDSRRLVTGSVEGSVRVWKAETGELEAAFEHGGTTRWVGVSPDSQRVLATGRGVYDVPSAANVWEFAGGNTRRVSPPLFQPNTIVHACFSADNRFLMTGDRSGLAQLWDLQTSQPIMNPMFVDGRGGISRVGINPQMTRVFAVTLGGQELHHRPLPPRSLAAPDWLPQLAEAVAGLRVDDNGTLESLNEQHLRDAKSRVARLPAQGDGEDFYTQWARWFFADRATRAVAPLDSFTAPDEVNQLLAHGSLVSLRRAHHISPADPRVFSALARETVQPWELSPGAPADPEAWSTAEWCARQAVERAPNSVEAHWSLAEVLLRLNQADAARAALTYAIRLQPDNPNVLAIQSELARRDGRTNEAHSLLARALNAPAEKPVSSYLQIAHVARRPDFFAEASLRNRMELRLAGRPPSLPAQFIDLTPWFTGSVNGSQTNSAAPVAEFPMPVLKVDGIPFDLRGVASFNTLPTAAGKHKTVLGIPIDQRCVRLHFLAGGTTSGLRVRVHYEGQPFRDFSLPTKWEDSVVSWDNPHSEVLIQTIDLIAQPHSEPRVAAITVQTSPDRLAPSPP